MAATPSHRTTASLLDPASMLHIRELLRSYSPPPDYLPSTISALSDKIARHDRRIEALRLELSTLETARAALQACHDDCGGLLAPIRRLPTELLVKILGIFAAAENETLPGDSPEAAMRRLNQDHLLALAGVCCRWYTIITETETLWDTIQLNQLVLCDTPARIDRTMVSLDRILKRGGKCPLNVEIKNVTNTPPHGPALELLGDHSKRWQTARFNCPASDLRYLSRVMGNLPQLEDLTLLCWGTPPLPVNIDMFEVAPRLRSLYIKSPNTVRGIWPAFAAFPLPFFHPLHLVRCSELLLRPPPRQISSMYLMAPLSRTAHFILDLLIRTSTPFTVDESIHFQPVTSEISAFTIEVGGESSPSNVGPTIAKIIGSLTLPALDKLSLFSTHSPALLVAWPHAEFLGLSIRSSFPTHLRALQLSHCIITEPELIECLSSLLSLEHLSISDHEVLPPITNSLLAQLTLTAATPSLVPQLRRFHCRSLLQFDDHVYLSFLLSRVQSGRSFDNHLSLLPNHHRKLDPIVVARLAELILRKELTFRFSRVRQF
ncbi:hypothetical protein FB451DRAFT_682673 [Mycena latifolia]|nr:hypothetical protein FB451DRAFT_682673 [Mycena latifolia]